MGALADWLALAGAGQGRLQQEQHVKARGTRRFLLRHECGHEKPVRTNAGRDQSWRARGGEEEADGSEWLVARLAWNALLIPRDRVWC
jgi:hypothetical protein